MTILLVRHARAGRRDKWQGDDRLRPLTKRGRAQADALPDVLTKLLETTDPQILSSPWVRCVQTMEPFARAIGRDVEIDEVLGEGMGFKAVAALPGWCRPHPVVLCTHGDVVDEVLAHLADMGLELGAPARAAKGALWVLECDDTKITSARYVAPV